ncbi:MAG: hypothetical protein JWM75_1099 [Sphingomonas bacterium]|jgi:predicted SnoaL-like aldol condensation-catalyzing enzyme|nr:hypothetical protein [Sphingomonas bacterium]
MAGHDAEDERRLALVRNLYQQVIFPLDESRVDDFIDADYVQHSPLAPPGRDALKQWLRETKAASPDSSQTLHRILVDGEHVVAHLHVRRWPGDPGLAVMDMYRIPADRIVEHWEVIQEVPENPINSNPMF